VEGKTSNKRFFTGIAIVAVALVAGLGGFFSGMGYQKSHGSAATLTASNSGDGPTTFNSDGSSRTFSGGPRMAGGGAIGSVTAVSASSITVKNARSGESTTYAIVSSTQITKDGTIASASDITTSSTVMVTPDSANTANALSITVDPSFGGMGGNTQNSIQTN
jgi:hypothetical protein